MRIAIFDVCDTIYKVNTTFSFLDFYLANNPKYFLFRRLSKFIPITILNYVIYKFIKKDLIRYMATLFLKNKNIEEIQNNSHKFVYNHLAIEIRKNVAEMLYKYKNQGYKIVLMSGSYQFIIHEVAKFFSVDYFYASELEIVNKFYTGKYKKDILLSKYDLLTKEFKNFTKLVVVSNNKTDLKLMLSADESIAICNKEKDTKFWKFYKNIICIEDY